MQPEPCPEPEAIPSSASASSKHPVCAAPGVAGVSSLTEKQLEQLLQAMPPQERKELGEWCRRQRCLPVRSLYHAPQDQYDGQPHTWFVRTLDTGRYARFEWPRMQMHAVPAMVSQEHLFKLSGRTFQQCAVPMAAFCWRTCTVCMAVALSRYERCRTGHVLAVNCPMKCLLKFIELQNRMNEVEGEGDELAQAAAAGAPMEAPDQDAVAKAVDAAGALEPGLQQLYTKKFGKSIQDDIVAAAAAAAASTPNSMYKKSPATPARSSAAHASLAELSAELVRYWEDHAITHGEEASGGGRELFRSEFPRNNAFYLLAVVPLLCLAPDALPGSEVTPRPWYPACLLVVFSQGFLPHCI